MKNLFIPTIFGIAAILAGCNETASEAAQDVVAARQGTVEESGQARAEDSVVREQGDAMYSRAQAPHVNADQAATHKPKQAESEAMIAAAMIDYQFAANAADGRYGIDEEKCDPLEGVDKRVCIGVADYAYSAAKADAEARRDAIFVEAATLK